MFYSYFKQYIIAQKLKEDIAQDACAHIIEDCLNYWQKPRWKNFFKKDPFGLYIYGQVGSGKTTLMDLMATFVQKKSVRLHYKFFMLDVHKNGFEETILAFKDIQFLFLDELDIIDIADAMIIQRLFMRLQKLGVYIITTSNLSPNQLYKNGLHYDRFEPFVPFIENNFKVFNLDNGVDYRKKHNLAEFYKFKESIPICVSLLDKSIEGYKVTDGVLFDFNNLFTRPLGPVHYQSLCEQESIVYVVNVPTFNHENADALRRFITFVDMIYDQKKCLIMLPEPYITIQSDIHQPIERLQSRLYEMASVSQTV